MGSVTPAQALALIESTTRGAGVDLWGAAANVPRFAFAPALPTALSLAMRVDPQALGRLEHGEPGPYRSEYRRLNEALDTAAARLARVLGDGGFAAVALPATIYDPTPASGDWLAAGVFPHKTAATQAGLGWIGKTGLFVSPELGPKVRLVTVFTDMELPHQAPITVGSCGTCRRCVEACPADAGRDVTWEAGIERAHVFDAAACRDYLDDLAQKGYRTCGLCVAACPFGRSDNSVA